MYVLFGALVGWFGCFTVLLVIGTMFLGPDGAQISMLGFFIGPPIGVVGGLLAWAATARKADSQSGPAPKPQESSWKVLGALTGFLVAPIPLAWIGHMIRGRNGSALGALGLLIGPPLGLFLGKWVSGRSERWIWACAGVFVGAVLGCFLSCMIGTGILGGSKAVIGWMTWTGLLLGGATGAAIGWLKAGRYRTE